MTNYSIHISTGPKTLFQYEYRKAIALNAARWFLSRYGMNIEPHPTITINIGLVVYKDIECWGECKEGKDVDYIIDIATDQSLRDFLATLMHEMIHLRQWETDRWEEDGEIEAEKLQYKLADDFWTCGIIW